MFVGLELMTDNLGCCILLCMNHRRIAMTDFGIVVVVVVVVVVGIAIVVGIAVVVGIVVVVDRPVLLLEPVVGPGDDRPLLGNHFYRPYRLLFFFDH